MWPWLKTKLHPAYAACIGVLLVAIGVEVSEETTRTILEVIAAVIVIVGFFLRTASG